MEENVKSKETKHLELKRKSKKIKKSFNLFDFVVVKSKNRKNQPVKLVKVSKQIQKRGKVRKKKLTTFKKRILRARIAKRLKVTTDDVSSQPDDERIQDNATKDITEKIAQIKLDNRLLDTIEITSSLKIPVEEFKDFLYSQTVDAVVESISKRPAVQSTSKTLANCENTTGQVQHSRNFREYCNHFITQDIKKCSELVLKDLFKYQENKFQQNPGELCK